MAAVLQAAFPDHLLRMDPLALSIACHTGRESCFYRRLDDGVWTTTDEPLKSPEDLYGKSK